jgi:hypothetical protein
MKKRISKLDDLVHAARNEAPVMSFEESARQIAALAQKRRKPLWTWLADAWAFPLRKFQALTDVDWLSEQRTFAHGFAGACVVAIVLAVFPSLIRDAHFAEKYQATPLAMQTSGNTTQAAGTRSLRGLHASPPNHLRKKDSESLALASQINVVAANADTTSSSLASSSAEASVAQVPEYSIATALRQQKPDESGFSSTPSQTLSILRQNPERSSTLAAEHTPTLPSALPQEQTFWQHISLEARMSARTDLASSLPSSLLPATESQASTPLQNLALGMYYALSEHHTVGIEGGNEPFMTAVRFNSNNGLTAAADSGRGITASLQPGSTTNPAVKAPDQYRQSSSNRTWFGAAYQYNADAWDVFGGVQPLARVTLGGGELGAVGRTLVGARFMAKEQFSILFAGEGAAVASQLQGAWNLTPRLGVTLGLSFKF